MIGDSPYFLNHIDLIVSFLRLPGALKVFKKLESFTFMIIVDELNRPLYELLNLSCDIYPENNPVFSAIFSQKETLKKLSLKQLSDDSLRNFFEGWCCKGGGGNKKIIVKRIEDAQEFTLSEYQVKVIEEYENTEFNLI
ncbi:1708_t:CDS:2 [Diversispora eburnea]|uniref:1708_t:CDS:1 n=1 Tax=Diversispora eburnea TaxID=1213867 RepID=A0A9N9BNG2_9GLOM|nr:1708_t:CDS:2 [Diversispora eburnea]